MGADRASAGELFLVKDPGDGLKAYKSGADNVVSFLTEGISSAEVQYLSALMDGWGIGNLTLF